MDQAKSDAFAERFVRDLNSTAVVLMTSIGPQVGSFDAGWWTTTRTTAHISLPPAHAAWLTRAAGPTTWR